MLDTRTTDLRRLNSATKYPSIPTYHALGEKGRLLSEHVDLGDDPLLLTEKVDGTNSRIILMPDGCYLIGSREELLHARGDLIHNPAMGIVDALRPFAEKLVTAETPAADVITIVYIETYGGKTTAAAKQYTGQRRIGFRMFDVSRVSVSQLNSSVEEISAWRESGGQQFLSEAELAEFSQRTDVELTPRIECQSPIPVGIDETHEWLQSHITTTQVALDDEAGGRPEGLVVRTADRSRIAKVRFEDYQRHARRQAQSRQ